MFVCTYEAKMFVYRGLHDASRESKPMRHMDRKVIIGYGFLFTLPRKPLRSTQG